MKTRATTPADRGHVSIVKQGELERPVIGRRRLDGRGVHCRDPIQAGRFDVFVEAGPL